MSKTMTAKELQWYKSMTVDQRINLKESCIDIVGYSWEWLGLLFTMKEILILLRDKLIMEGFELKNS